MTLRKTKLLSLLLLAGCALAPMSAVGQRSHSRTVQSPRASQASRAMRYKRRTKNDVSTSIAQ